jgi:transcriptional regulator with XRE-family HTH domain
MAKPSPTYSRNKELVALGLAVREFRMKKGWSQETFADHAGIDRSYIGGIERGEHNLAIMNLLKISSALGVKGHALLEEADL